MADNDHSNQHHNDRQLSGLIARVTFHNPDTGFCVLRVRVEGHRRTATVLANMPTVSAGEWLQAEGKWIEDSKYGPQFQASTVSTSEPSSEEGIERYLSSGMIHGIGDVYAQKLVAFFGTDVLDVIEKEPKRLLEVPGIGNKRSSMIVEAWEAQRAVRSIMLFLHSHGVGSALAARVYKTYGDKAVQIISDNPYRLIEDIKGVGFQSADTIAGRLGIEQNSDDRIRAGLVHTLNEANTNGHCGLPHDEIVLKAAELLGVDENLVTVQAKVQVKAKRLITASVGAINCLFPTTLFESEQYIGKRLAKMATMAPPWSNINTDKALNWVGGQLGFALSDSQAQAVGAVLKQRLMVITGGPGVGKTTIMLAILKILLAKKITVNLCAPTGRSAKRLQESTGQEAKTIHRMLEFNPVNGGFIRDENLPLDTDFVIVDEASMVDVPLMHSLIKAVPPHAGLLMVGDIDQLPSVGPGRVLADLIQSGVIAVTRLNEVFRQVAHSRIVTNAHLINMGDLPDLEADNNADFFFVPADTGTDAAEKINLLVTERIPKRFGFNPLEDIQVLCPMRRGAVGTMDLNEMLQASLNPYVGNTIKRSGWTYMPGDKVMQTANDYNKEVYNGDIGQIISIDSGKTELKVSFDQQITNYKGAELDALVPAYAITIHKSQGSEYAAVVIPVMRQHFIMLQRSLLYTAVTRGKKLVVLVGEQSAIATAVHSAAERGRWTRLAECLRLPDKANR